MGNKLSGNGTINLDNGHVYEGQYQQAAPHGMGKMTYKDGRITEGIWKHGKLVYEGELNEKGEPHGKGKMIYSNGTYEGEWKDGLGQGRGVYNLDNGEVFEGELRDGRSDGKGIAKYPDGSSYVGQYQDGSAHGKGIYTWADGSYYDGDLKYGNRDGKGIEKTSEGRVIYEGGYKDDCRDGNGTGYFKNGDVYSGAWCDDEINGTGIMTYANKDVYHGQWKKGYKNGEGTMKFHNGDVYKGEFSDDKMHGVGEYEYAEAAAVGNKIMKSIGTWKEGKKCGLFKDIYLKQVYYDNDEITTESIQNEEAKGGTEVKHETKSEDKDVEEPNHFPVYYDNDEITTESNQNEEAKTDTDVKHETKSEDKDVKEPLRWKRHIKAFQASLL